MRPQLNNKVIKQRIFPGHMPTYEYECTSCKKGFDFFQKMTENPLQKCPSCGKNKLKKKIGMGAGIIFKGSGFYCTDYKSNSYKEGEKKSKSENSSSSTTTSKTSSSETTSPKTTDKKQKSGE